MQLTGPAQPYDRRNICVVVAQENVRGRQGHHHHLISMVLVDVIDMGSAVHMQAAASAFCSEE